MIKRNRGKTEGTDSPMTPTEEEFFKTLNTFREEPTTIKPALKNIKAGIKKQNPKDPMIAECKNLKKRIPGFAPVPALYYSDELSKAAHEYLEKCAQNPPEKKVLTDDECRGIVPDSFMEGKSFTMVYYNNNYEYPEQSLINLLIGGADDKDNLGQAYVISELIEQVGIAIQDSNIVLMFDDDKVEESDWNPGYDDSELKLAFHCLDSERKNKLDISKVVDMIEEQGLGESNPTLSGMFKDLKEQGKRFITYPEFAEFFNSKVQHLENDPQRDQDIFNLYLKNEKDNKLVDKSYLKDIKRYLKLDVADEKIDEMLQGNQNNKDGICLDDYMNIIANKLKK